ncbi:Na+/H+ antiporter NhaC [Sanyastnella coralliicola]|uniref:Na+/H+ antiporter NhaC n=1 Tax=Sanyastnella coralliicola TaxID=3069118 RepID=UPI0027BA3881|nr:Na+/H+ antiporter NhaC [Longitalea sp. SCSIO 12813]
MNNSASSLLLSLVPIVVLIALLGLNVVFYGEDSSYGPNQIALLTAGGVAAGISLLSGEKWKKLYDGITESISSALGAILILLMIGALAGTWLLSGVIPAMIYYGLEILNPTIFLFATTIVCAIVSLATGSSWGTVGTVGVALIAIGQALGIGEGWVAGAIISGAYFGDKMSPLSDTTNLAPAIAGTDLFTHIRHMIWTTGPSIIIALIVFLVAGFTVDLQESTVSVGEMQQVMAEKFNLGWWLMLVPIAVIVMIAKKVPAVPALFIGSIIGGIFAVIFQPQIIMELAGEGKSFANSAYSIVVKAMALDTSIETGNDEINRLLSAGGMYGMMNTVWLILCALTFGGILQAAGMLRRITSAILSVVTGSGGLVASTAGTCIVFNVLASDQYLAIVVPGKMFADAYKDQGLAPENLSRALEDSGTVTSVLIPWNTCGVAQSGVLGVATLAYAPYCIFNIVSPFMTVLFGLMGWKLNRLPAKIGSDGLNEG